MSDPTVTLTLGILGEGERTVELTPGESIEESFDGVGYVQVAVPEFGTEMEFEVSGTTHTQDTDSSADRVDTVKRITCSQCGTCYQPSYTRCPECGLNQDGGL